VPEGRAGRCVGAGVSRGAKSHTAQIDKHQSDVCTLLHASLSLSYVSISTPCDFLYYLQSRTYFSEALLPARPRTKRDSDSPRPPRGGGAAEAPSPGGRPWRWESRRRTPLELNWTNAYVANTPSRDRGGEHTPQGGTARQTVSQTVAGARERAASAEDGPRGDCDHVQTSRQDAGARTSEPNA